jgi:Protein of unknown function (DUF433).
MKDTLHKNELGFGIYTVPDISRLLNFKQAKVRRYLEEYWDERMGRELFQDTYSWSADGRVRAVNFYVLIELFTFFRLQEHGVKTNTILKARNHISKEMNVPYPFASAGVLTDGKKIWYEFQDSIINADGTRQTNFIQIIRDFVEKVDFGENKLAEHFFPDGRGSSVIVDPHHQFGQPIINGTNVNAEILFSMYQSGEPLQSIGILYDLTEKEVNDAIRFFKPAA